MKSTRNQRLVWWNSGFWAVFSSLTASFIIPFVLILGASNKIVGVLSAIPYFAIIFTQIPGAKITAYFPRKVVWVVFAILERLFWIFLALTPLFFVNNLLFFVILFYIFICFFQFIREPAWTSMLNDIVPKKIRGYFFGKKNMITNFVFFLSFISAGFFLDLFPEDSYFAFLFLFCIGVLFGLVSVGTIIRVKEPKFKDDKHHGIKEFFKLEPEFRKFVYIISFFKFAFMFASPFFVVYLLDNLELSYTFFVFVTAISIFSRVVSQVHLGRLADRFGDKPVALLSMVGTAIVPLLYLFITKDTLWLIIPTHLIAGFAWGAYETTSVNLLLDLSNKKNILVHTASFQMLTSIVMIVAPILGGFVADSSFFPINGIFVVFLLSFILRFLGGVSMFALKEPRNKKEYPVAYVFRQAIKIHPLKGIEHTFTRIMHNHKK